MPDATPQRCGRRAWTRSTSGSRPPARSDAGSTASRSASPRTATTGSNGSGGETDVDVVLPAVIDRQAGSRQEASTLREARGHGVLARRPGYRDRSDPSPARRSPGSDPRLRPGGNATLSATPGARAPPRRHLLILTADAAPNRPGEATGAAGPGDHHRDRGRLLEKEDIQ